MKRLSGLRSWSAPGVWRDLAREMPDQVFLTVGADRKLYYGNTGLRTVCLGDLRTDSPERLTEAVRGLASNWDYSAYYDLERLPPLQWLLEHTAPEADYVYDSTASCLYRWLDRQAVEPVLLPEDAARGGGDRSGRGGARESQNL